MRRLDSFLNRLARDKAIVSTRCPVFLSVHPKPEDTLVAVEVSDTTLAHDVNVKLPAYARAGAPEAWIVDAGVIRIHTNPVDGEYRSESRIKRGEMFESEALSGARIAAGDILG